MYDPTHTLTLRNLFARQMRRRFNDLARIIRQALIIQDVFGTIENLEVPPKEAFSFLRSAEKIDAFMAWLKRQEEAGVLSIHQGIQIGQGFEQPWTNTYIESAYQKGILRARQELIKAGHDVPTMAETGGMRVAFNQPIHADRVGLLYTRVFGDLKGVTATMGTQISRLLAKGMADGKNPRIIAEELNKVITGIGDLSLTDTLGRFIPAKRRAEMIARTEIIRAHHSATIQEYRNWGVDGVSVKAELRTAGDDRVCAICESLEGNVYTLQEAENIIPVHTRCRCITIPVDISR